MISDPLAYDAYLFDCDGTLADTMPAHHRSWVRALKASGATFDFPYDLMCSWGGKGHRETVEDLNRIHHTQLDWIPVVALQEKFFHEEMGRIEPISEAVALARYLAQFRPVGVVSGGLRNHVEEILTQIELRSIFGAVVAREDVSHSKPDPEAFLLGAHKLGVSASRCMAFEDSPTGMASARAAGMKVVDIREIIPDPAKGLRSYFPQG